MALALAILTALMPLVPVFIDLYQGKVALGRRRRELEEDYERDLAEAERAIAWAEPATLTRLFELERRALLRRSADGLRGPADDRDPGGPGDHGAA